MGDGVSSEFERFVEERKLVRARISRGMILKEMEAAQADLQDARDSSERRKFKWATIQGYYSMFHSARALLYHRGFREKSHYALLVAVRVLYSNELEPSMIDRFEEAMNLRQEADYGLKFSEAGAVETIEGAEGLLQRATELLKLK
jgi:uncharacterized protein (UPF0332 family)